jgi:predicted peptidase
MRPRLRFFLALLLTPAIPLFARLETGFLNRTIQLQKETYRYQVYLPAGFSKAQRLAVILFLHGAGERGDDGLAQTQVGIAGAIRLHPERYPAIVVMPQCRKDKRWIDPDMTEMALAALDASIREFKGDRNRVYLTGLSMGGAGTLGIGSKHADRFAAMAAICGRAGPPRNAPPPPPGTPDPYETTAKGIGLKPIWLFHGDADPTVPVTESRKMVEALKAIGSSPKYTEYPGVGHNSWDRAYNDEELAKWLFAQHK